MKLFKLAGKQNTSSIIIEEGILKEAAEFCRTKSTESPPSKICIVTDSNVAKLHLKLLEEKLAGLFIPLYRHIIPAGEEYKTLKTVSDI